MSAASEVTRIVARLSWLGRWAMNGGSTCHSSFSFDRAGKVGQPGSPEASPEDLQAGPVPVFEERSIVAPQREGRRSGGV